MNAPILESGQAEAMSLLISGLIAAVITLLLAVFTMFLTNTRRRPLPSSRALALLVYCLPLLGWAMSGVVEGIFWARNPPLVEPLTSVAEPIITFLVVPLRIIGPLILLLRLVVSYHQLPTLCSWPPQFNHNDSPKVYRQGPIWVTKVLFLALLPFVSVFTAHMVVFFHAHPSVQVQDVIGARIRFSFAVIEGAYMFAVVMLLCVLFPVGDAIRRFDLHVMRTAATSLLTLLIYLLVTCVLEYYRMEPKTFANMREMQHKIEAVELAQTILYHINMYLNIALWCLLYYAARTIEVDAKSEGLARQPSNSNKYPSYLASESATLIIDGKKAPEKVKESPLRTLPPSSDAFNYNYFTATPAPRSSTFFDPPSQDLLVDRGQDARYRYHSAGSIAPSSLSSTLADNAAPESAQRPDPIPRYHSVGSVASGPLSSTFADNTSHDTLTRQDSLTRYSSVGNIGSPKLTRNYDAITRPRSDSFGREQMRRMAKLKRMTWEKSQPLATVTIPMDSQDEIVSCVRTSSV